MGYPSLTQPRIFWGADWLNHSVMGIRPKNYCNLGCVHVSANRLRAITSCPADSNKVFWRVLLIQPGFSQKKIVAMVEEVRNHWLGLDDSVLGLIPNAKNSWRYGRFGHTQNGGHDRFLHGFRIVEDDNFKSWDLLSLYSNSTNAYLSTFQKMVRVNVLVFLFALWLRLAEPNSRCLIGVLIF